MKPFRLEFLAGALLFAGGIGLTIVGLRGIRDNLPLSFDPPVVNLGEVREGVVKGQFKITNVGDTCIKILGIRRECRCSSLELPKSELDVGESTVCKFEWDLTGQKFDTDAKILLAVSPADQSENRLHQMVELIAFVKPDFLLSQDKLYIDVRENKLAGSLDLVPHGMADAKIVDVSVSHPSFEARLISDNRVQVTATDVHDFGGESALLNIVTNSDCRTVVQVPIVALR